MVDTPENKNRGKI